ncbi:FG-GAP repeat domain-containing protein [Actinokineospora diospyrosa]|uniref:VCBS repeat protein n=1 Tax=Actinokineospora diospyrosa TaxID=103728 RepID=A0ABT1ICC2_9PSEU|nr:VCBS repeat-containing protein [Actinokineospora diospyrosa]MCP2270214.1 hypothetical protein [Actinokineospora diospyrosa]
MPDIVLYRPADGSLRVILKNAGGGFSGYGGNPIRTGLGAPTWAGVADLDGDGQRDDIAWWSGTTLSTLVAPNFTTSSSTPGLQPGTWHDVLDYNGDGRDDVVLFRPADGSLRVILKDPGGGFNGYSGNPIRTGLTTPIWAGTSSYNG